MEYANYLFTINVLKVHRVNIRIPKAKFDLAIILIKGTVNMETIVISVIKNNQYVPFSNNLHVKK